MWFREEVLENGNCFFLAIERQFSAIWPPHMPRLTPQLQRKIVADYFQEQNPKARHTLQIWQELRNEPEHAFMRYVGLRDSIGTQMYRLRELIQNKDYFWAEDASIQIVVNYLAKVLGRKVILRLVRKTDNVIIPIRSSNNQERAFITYLYYKENKHYEPLVWKDSTPQTFSRVFETIE